jgi:hypothetical protein
MTVERCFYCICEKNKYFVPCNAVDVSPDSNNIPYAMRNLITSCTNNTVDLLIVEDVYRRVMIGWIPNCMASNIMYSTAL